jgi:hypothetical protein
MEVVVFFFLVLFIPPLFFHPAVHTEGRDFPFLYIFGALMLGAFAQAHQVV